MAPEDTVPIAIFPPFVRSPDYPTKCVIFSQLTDFEEAHIIDLGNIQVIFKILKDICYCFSFTCIDIFWESIIILNWNTKLLP
jgi:hypothetical protein